MSVKTRWNSTFFMLSRIKSFRTEIEILLGDKELVKQYSLVQFVEDDWKQIDKLTEVLEEFFIELVELEYDKKATINCTTCSYMYLFKHCEKMRMTIKGDKIYENIENGLKEAQQILNKYFNKGSLFSYAGMLLDPRLKSTKYEERGWLDDAVYLNKEYVNIIILDFKNIFQNIIAIIQLQYIEQMKYPIE